MTNPKEGSPASQDGYDVLRRENALMLAPRLVIHTAFGHKDSMLIPAATVAIHPSQFPEQLHGELVSSLRQGKLNPKFLYDSVRQTQKWLGLHAACSPTRTDPKVSAIYNLGFEQAVANLKFRSVHVIGLGCGGGTKDTRLLRLLQKRGFRALYTPCDVSTAMVLTARQAALKVIDDKQCFPLVCDLAQAEDLPKWFCSRPSPFVPRLFTFFGMIPNFEPKVILPKLAALVRRRDLLLFSANLAPGQDYAAGVRHILPQYDNAWTRDWLMSFLIGLGVAPRAGELKFGVELEPNKGLRRVVAHFYFRRPQEIEIDTDRIRFQPKRPLRLFFSYRHTPDGISKLLARHGLEVREHWVAASKEEGVFLCRKK